MKMAGISDVYTSSKGHTRTLGNFVKATFAALRKTYAYLTPDLWQEQALTMSPFQEFTDHLSKEEQAKIKVNAGYDRDDGRDGGRRQRY